MPQLFLYLRNVFFNGDDRGKSYLGNHVDEGCVTKMKGGKIASHDLNFTSNFT